MPVQINPKLFLEWSQRSVSLREPVSWKPEMSEVKDKRDIWTRPKATNSANALEMVEKLVG